MQELRVYLIILLAASYAAWRVYKALKAANDPCHGCEGCALRDIKRKKDCEKFGGKK